ncbi:MAG: L-histidine N(alpha)-methyltransferase [Verrucomicrobia bacterium]|nr:L-histidine N(alpha)-methyltransferase [Verrucomicrobiota bacterium]
MPASFIQVGVHSSQWPERVRAELHTSLRTRRIHPKFHYESRQQAHHWLRLHEAHSPARRDDHCQATYDLAFDAVTHAITEPFQLIGLGCGGGQKERRLLDRIPNAATRASFVGVDGSSSLAIIARQEAARVLPESNCHAFVCDLATAAELLPEFDRLAGTTQPRILTCFGVLPNFQPNRFLPQLAALLRPNDLLLLSANLAREDDYTAHLRRILPQYDNSLTRDWLFLLLADLGIAPGDGQFDCQLESDSAWDPLARIVISFVFTRPRCVILDDEEYRFEREDRLQLFFSYRHTPSSVPGLLARHGITVESQWITPSAEEGIFTCRRIGG